MKDEPTQDSHRLDAEMVKKLGRRISGIKDELEAIRLKKLELLHEEHRLKRMLMNMTELLHSHFVDAGSASPQVDRLTVLNAIEWPTVGGRDSMAELILTRVEEALRDSRRPMHYRDLLAAVSSRVLVGGRDPGATLLSYLNRARDRFRRVGTGTYWLKDEPDPSKIAKRK